MQSLDNKELREGIKTGGDYPDRFPRGNGTYRCILTGVHQHHEGLDQYFPEFELVEMDRADSENTKTSKEYEDSDGNIQPARPYGAPVIGQTYSLSFNPSHQKKIVRDMALEGIVCMVCAASGQDPHDINFKADPVWKDMLEITESGEDIGLPIEIKAIEKPRKKDGELFTNFYFNIWYI